MMIQSRKASPADRENKAHFSYAFTPPKGVGPCGGRLRGQKIANRFNNEGVPTLSGKGRWQKGPIGNLLAQAEN